MKQSKFPEAQKAFFLKQGSDGLISPATDWACSRRRCGV